MRCIRKCERIESKHAFGFLGDNWQNRLQQCNAGLASPQRGRERTMRAFFIALDEFPRSSILQVAIGDVGNRDAEPAAEA